MSKKVLGEVLGGIDEFVSTINQGIDHPDVRVNRSYLTEMDHVCYRVETEERYQQLLRQLSVATHLVAPPTMVNGRPIATFELPEPIETGGWAISYLELPAPKPGSMYTEGLEHAEFVVRGGSLERFRAAHTHLDNKFSTGGINKSINPELGLKIDQNDLKLSVKFHELALGKVVRIERGVDPIAGNHVTL